MVIAREGSTKNTTATGQSSATFNHTLVKASGNNRLVVVGVNFEEDSTNSRYVTGVTYGGTSMTQLATYAPISFPDSGLKCYVDLYYILDSSLPATTGSKEIVVTLDGVCTDEICSYVAEYSGVNQTAPDDSDNHENLSAGATSVTITATAAGSVGILVCGSGGSTDPNTRENNCTTVQSTSAASSAGALAELLDQSAGFTLGYNSLATREGCIGAVWQPALLATQTHQMML